MKCHHKSIFYDQSYAQMKKDSRQYNKKCWKRLCPWSCRPRTCAHAYFLLKISKTVKPNSAVFYNYYIEKKRWQ